MRSARPASPVPFLLAALAGAVACTWALWPGVVTFDGVAQYGQAVSGRYDDWHPPLMARLWSLLLAAGLSGTGPLLAVQGALAWAGAGLLAAALGRAGRPRAALFALAAPLFPIAASWAACVLKDCLLVSVLACATGIVAWFRLQGGRLPRVAAAGVAVLLVAAALMRGNAAFSVLPLALGWAGWLGMRRTWARGLLLVLGCGGVIALSGPVNHRLLGAEPSLVERTLPVFDMAGVAHFARLPDLPQLPQGVWRRAEAHGCYTPFYWDLLGNAARCGGIATTLAFDRDEDAPSIVRDWAGLVLRHPLAYLEHRAAHLNATFRIAVPADERLATGPARSLLNAYGLGLPDSRAAAALAPVAGWLARTPLGAPVVWLAAALALAWVARSTPAQPALSLAHALLASALVQWASFAVVSIASDLRYHLWPMLATWSAAALLAGCQGVPRARVRAAGGAVLVAALASALLRALVLAPVG